MCRGQPVKLTMASEDVIHSFFIPAFRVRHDVVPGITTAYGSRRPSRGAITFSAPNIAATSTAGMIGWVDVMEPREYQRTGWRSGGVETRWQRKGKKLFRAESAARTCHLLDRTRTLSESARPLRQASATG